VTAIPLTTLVDATVVTRHFDHYATVHRTDSGCIRGPVTVVVATTDARTIGVQWCTTCWPGRRCGTCGDPSGSRRDCGPCEIADIGAEKRYDIGTGWAA
jgi:hypothetical protein